MILPSFAERFDALGLAQFLMRRNAPQRRPEFRFRKGATNRGRWAQAVTVQQRPVRPGAQPGFLSPGLATRHAIRVGRGSVRGFPVLLPEEVRIAAVRVPSLTDCTFTASAGPG